MFSDIGKKTFSLQFSCDYLQAQITLIIMFYLPMMRLIGHVCTGHMCFSYSIVSWRLLSWLAAGLVGRH